MKYTISLIALFILVPLFAFAMVANGQGDNVKQTREVSSFSSISLSVSADIHLKQGTKQEVIVEGDKDVLDVLKTEVQGKTLKIYLDKWSMQSYKKVTIYITMRDIDGLTITGSGNITAETPVNTSDIDFTITGSGDIHISELKAEQVKASITGSGTINLAGKQTVSSMDVHISGSGDVNADGLEVKNFDASITGSGDCRITATELLKARVSGSGDIYYKGKPRMDVNITGSGKLRSL